MCCLEEGGWVCHFSEKFQFPTNTKYMFSLIFIETVPESLPPLSQVTPLYLRWCSRRQVALKVATLRRVPFNVPLTLRASCFKEVKELSYVRNDRGEFTLGLLFPDGENSSLPHRGFGDVTSKVMEELSYFLLQNGQLEAVPVSLQN